MSQVASRPDDIIVAAEPITLDRCGTCLGRGVVEAPWAYFGVVECPECVPWEDEGELCVKAAPVPTSQVVPTP